MAGKLFNHSNLIWTLFAGGFTVTAWLFTSLSAANSEIAVLKTEVKNATKSNEDLRNSIANLESTLEEISRSTSRLQESSEIIKKQLGLAELDSQAPIMPNNTQVFSPTNQQYEANNKD